ncbi:MAG: hypothetical protein JXA83_09780 [Acidimicrobiales bacterium]|nr:hypothetical protein [Acidimicrobiales bacterium]
MTVPGSATAPRPATNRGAAARDPVAWLLAPAPAARLAALRILVGGYATVWAIVRLPAHLAHADQVADRWDPVGVLAPLSSPPPDAGVVAVAVAAPLLGLLLVAGRGFRLTGPLCAAAVLVLASLDSSWGQVFHTENLMVLHLVILALAPGAADALVLRRRASGAVQAEPAPAPGPRYGWPVRLAGVVVVLTYLVTGIAKLRLAGAGWADGEALRNLVAFDNVRKALLGDAYSPVGTGLVEHAWVFAPLAVLTLAVELGAWVALLGGRWRTAWVAAAWLFHLGVLVLMAIVFAYPLTGIAFAPLFRLEVLVDRVRGLGAARGGRRG